MTTINIKSFKGKSFNDVYVFIMQKQEVAFKLVIPRQETNEASFHYKTIFDFVCAGYAASLLQGVATDFSYTVPSVNKKKPFEFFLETTEPEKFADIVYTLLVAYNDRFISEETIDFNFLAANYYHDTLHTMNQMTVPGIGLLAVGDHQVAQRSRHGNI